MARPMMARPMTRRQGLSTATQAACAAAAANAWNSSAAATPSNGYPPQRTITRGPKHHWFAYYDKLQFEPSGRYCLGMQVDFEHRSPRPDDVIQIGMVDLQDEDRWIELDESRAWGWQQGCMLQWVPGSDRQILWNDRASDLLFESRWANRVFSRLPAHQRHAARLWLCRVAGPACRGSGACRIG